MDYLRDLLGYTIAMFTIMNPLSAGAIMLTLVNHDATISEMRIIANKTSKAVLLSMVIFFLSGSYIFQFFGIEADSLRVFGGIILLTMGFNMVKGRDKPVNHTPGDQLAASNKEDITVVPLAIPIIVGPGLATTLVTMSVESPTLFNHGLILLAIFINAFFTWLILVRMPYIKKRLGLNGLKVFNRLLGLVVGAIGIQMLIAGTLGLLAHFSSKI